MRSFAPVLLLAFMSQSQAFSLSMKSDAPSRRAFFTEAATGAASIVGASVLGFSQPALAAPEIFTTDSGIKYAITKESKKKIGLMQGAYPQKGDIVAIEYTGYLTNGQIWDSTHAEGKNSVLLFNLGTDVVIDGINDMVSNMLVGQKVQCIIPANLAFGDKGLCIDGGECLIKPGATLVYDILLKQTSIPSP